MTTRWLNPAILDPDVLAAIDALKIVDTHEHLDEESVRLTQPPNLTRFFMYYTFNDMASAGDAGRMSAEDHKLFWKDGASGEEQWRAIRKAWPLARHTGFAAAVRLSIKELYGVDDLTDESVPVLLREIEKRNRPGVLDWILKEKCGIECCLVNAADPGDFARRTGSPGLFLFDISVSQFCNNKMDLAPYEKASGIEVRSLADCRRMIDWFFDRWAAQGNGIKNVCAYWRPLAFAEISHAQATDRFDRWVLGKDDATPIADKRMVQDHLFHHCLARAADHKLPVKLHTGYHAGNDYMDMSLFQVKDLQPLFRRYGSVKFDIFHLSYPEWTDLVALAKHYTNVYANLCWAWIIDPHASIEFCRHALTALPLNRVLGFGGDYGFADPVYGHARIARDGIALVLTEAVRDGRMTKADAIFAAQRWLRDNAMEVYRIDEKRAAQAKGQPEALPQ